MNISKWSINKHMKRYSTELVEMQIKTTVRYHFTPTRMAIKKKKKRETRVAEDVAELEPSYAAGRNVKWWCMVQPFWKSLQFLKKLKTDLALIQQLYS